MNNKIKFSAKQIAYTSIIAALYVGLTFAVLPLAHGAIQFRLSEALTILPALFPAAIPGLAIGCFIANIVSNFGLIDMFLGSFATLIAAFMSFLFRKKLYVAAIPPVLINAFIVPIIFIFSGDLAYWFNVGTVFLGQFVVIYAIGLPLTYILRKRLKKYIVND